MIHEGRKRVVSKLSTPLNFKLVHESCLPHGERAARTFVICEILDLSVIMMRYAKTCSVYLQNCKEIWRSSENGNILTKFKKRLLVLYDEEGRERLVVLSHELTTIRMKSHIPDVLHKVWIIYASKQLLQCASSPELARRCKDLTNAWTGSVIANASPGK